MNSRETKLCVCGCTRKSMEDVSFNVDKEGKFCEKCGKKFELIPAPMLGVQVRSEGDQYDNQEWITFRDLKVILESIK